MKNFAQLPRLFHVGLMLSLLLIIVAAAVLPLPILSLLFLPCLILFIGLSIYYILKSKHKLAIIAIVTILSLFLLSAYVIAPYYRFQQDDFLENKVLKMCGNEQSANAPDFIFCDTQTPCHIKNNHIYLDHGRDNQPLQGTIIKREWRIYDGGVVYLKFYPYSQINRYCL